MLLHMEARQPGSVLSGSSGGAVMVRGAAATLVILGTGGVGLVGAFSDASPGESVALRLVLLAFVQVAGAALVGLLVPRWWLLAVLTAWGPLLLGSVGLYVKLRHHAQFPHPRFLVLSLVVPSVLAIAGGLLGRWWILQRR
jgi:hypothetical protein